jgi:hypothetical protein
MNPVVVFLLLTISGSPVALAQCAIRPIKPIPPIGCKDVTPECISDGSGKSHWNWICVPNNAGADTRNDPVWKPRQTEPAPPNRANATPHQAVPSTSANAPSQESAAAQEPAGVPIGEMNASEQHAAEQLRAITEAIKSCPHDVYRMPASIEAMEASDGMIETFGPPTNVIWNVEPNPSGRTHFLGLVEYVFPRSEMPPVDFCKRWRMKKKYCSEELHLLLEDYDRQEAHPWQFRYEFDITSHGPEFVRSFGKTKQRENEPWLPGGAEVCGKRAISLVLSDTGTNK